MKRFLFLWIIRITKLLGTETTSRHQITISNQVMDWILQINNQKCDYFAFITVKCPISIYFSWFIYKKISFFCVLFGQKDVLYGYNNNADSIEPKHSPIQTRWLEDSLELNMYIWMKSLLLWLQYEINSFTTDIFIEKRMWQSLIYWKLS